MKFDRMAPGGGVDVACRLENGKTFLEWEFYVTDEAEGMDIGKGENEARRMIIRVFIIDKQGNTAAECVKSLQEEEPLQSILVQPHLWNSTTSPYQYSLEAVLEDRNGSRHDRICRQLPLRCMEQRGARGLFLNGAPFSPKLVCYSLPAAGSEAERQRLIMEDFRQLLRLGANCIYIQEKEELPKFFLQLCDRVGLVALVKKGEYIYIWGRKIKYQFKEEIPLFREETAPDEMCDKKTYREEKLRKEASPEEMSGKEVFQQKIFGEAVFGGEICLPKKGSLFPADSMAPNPLFYQYMARWSREPFIYIVPESVKRLQSGNYSALCYSNSSRVALYSDGILFEFKKGEGEFAFQEIPAKTPCIMLTAEGDGCSTSLSLHKTFLKNCSQIACGDFG